MGFDYDFIVIGSGFGGSVSALRLTEKGYKVCVLEAGKRYADDDFAKTTWNVRKYLWIPKLGCYGIMRITPLGNMLILSGTGVGGGSLGYACTLLEPPDPFYRDPQWADMQDWKQTLAPHFETARTMLGVTRGPAFPLPEGLQIVEGEIVPGQVQEAVQQHGSVAIGQDKTITVRPVWIMWIMSHKSIPEHKSHRRLP